MGKELNTKARSEINAILESQNFGNEEPKIVKKKNNPTQETKPPLVVVEKYTPMNRGEYDETFQNIENLVSFIELNPKFFKNMAIALAGLSSIGVVIAIIYSVTSNSNETKKANERVNTTTLTAMSKETSTALAYLMPTPTVKIALTQTPDISSSAETGNSFPLIPTVTSTSSKTPGVTPSPTPARWYEANPVYAPSPKETKSALKQHNSNLP